MLSALRRIGLLGDVHAEDGTLALALRVPTLARRYQGEWVDGRRAGEAALASLVLFLGATLRRRRRGSPLGS